MDFDSQTNMHSLTDEQTPSRLFELAREDGQTKRHVNLGSFLKTPDAVVKVSDPKWLVQRSDNEAFTQLMILNPVQKPDEK